MVNPIVKYQGITEEQLKCLPEEKVLELCHNLLTYCNHTVIATSEKVRVSLAKCDVMDSMAELYRITR